MRKYKGAGIGATTEVQDHIFCNMSKTTANMLKEDLQFIGQKFMKHSPLFLEHYSTSKKNGILINSLQPSQIIKKKKRQAL